ncbi:MAG: glycoside hydrolase family 5 protein [Alphaproteobacteria bacterium]
MTRLTIYALCFFAFNMMPAMACTLNPAGIVSNVNHNALDKGVNIAEIWQKSPRKPLLQSDISNIKSLGFTFIRLPISEIWLDSDNEAVLNDIRCDIVALLNAGLVVVVDLHLSGSARKALGGETDVEALRRLEEYWTVLGGVVNGLPSQLLYLSLLNEPPKEMENWWDFQENLIANLREDFPDHTFIASDIFGMYGKLDKKVPYADQNVFYDFHFYSPMFFTHHNAQWLIPAPDEREKTDNVLYPSSGNAVSDENYTKMADYIEQGWDKAKLARLLEVYPVRWGERTGAKVLCLEFGVYRPYVDNDARLQWLGDMKELFDEYDIPWALWNYKGGYGIYYGGRLDVEMAETLGLTP